MKPTLFSVKIYTSHSYFRVYQVIVLCTGFDFKKINTIIAYMNLFWFLNKNHKMQFEKWICWQNIFLYMTVTHIWMQKKLRRHKIPSRILCTFTELNQLIFGLIKRKKGFRSSELFSVHTKYIHMPEKKRMSYPQSDI